MSTVVSYRELVGAGERPRGARRKRRIDRGEDALDGRFGRRRFVTGATATAGAVGVASLGVFPRAREAAASHAGSYGYRVRGLPCPSYAASANCNPGCGPSQVAGDGCVTSGERRGWFKNGGDYRLRPGQCSANADAWMWQYSGSCGRCASLVEFRCHDGYKNIGGSWQPRICRWTTRCESTFYPEGHVDAVTCHGGRIRVRGWARDRNTAGAILVHVYEHDVARTAARADRPRSDVGAHGFDVTFGSHTRRGRKTRVCVYGINAGPGRNKRLGCVTDRCT